MRNTTLRMCGTSNQLCDVSLYAAFFMEGIRDQNYDDVLESWNQGCIELVSEVVAYALLTNSATLECGYQAFLQSGCPAALRPQVVELHKRHRAWLADIAGFTNTLKAEGTSVQTLEYLEIALTQMIERVADLAKRSIAEN